MHIQDMNRIAREPAVRPNLIKALPAVLALMATSAWAQTSPAADAAAPAAAPVLRGVDPLALPPSQTPEFVLREMQLPRLTTVTDEEVNAIVLPHLRQVLDAGRRRQIAEALRALLESRGLVLAGVAVRTVDAAQGIARVVVIEPRLGRIDVPPVDDAPISEARVLGMLAGRGLAKGSLLDLNRLDEAMFLLNDMPGVGARANIAPSGDEGVFDLSVERTARKRYEASVDADNHGSRYSGRNRLGLFGRWNNPTHAGDNLDARVVGSAGGGLLLGRLAYERPLGASPLRASLGVSRVSYELGAELAVLEPTGHANVIELALTQALLRSRDRNLIGRLAIDTKKAQDRLGLDGIEVNRIDKTLRDLLLGLSFEARDSAGGGGYNGGAVALQVGHLRIDTADWSAADTALGSRATQGTFAKLSLQASRLQAIAPQWSGYVGVSAQWANKNLDSSEKFTLGGAQGVRAYPGGEVATDRGVLLTLEVRRAIDSAWSVFGLYDAGAARIQSRPAPGVDNSRTLHGFGLGVHFSHPEWFTLKANVARRGSVEPTSVSDDSRVRFNLQIQRAF